MHHTMLGYSTCLGFCYPQKAMLIYVISPAGYFLLKSFVMSNTFKTLQNVGTLIIFIMAIIFLYCIVFILYSDRYI